MASAVQIREVSRRVEAAWPVRPMLLVLVCAAILLLGAVEDVYGVTDSGDLFGSDGVQYLDVARAMGRGDWHSALNPLWSQGYPALLAGARPLFAAGPMGDWTTIRVVNFGVFGFSLLAFLLLLLRLQARVETRARTLFRGGGLAVFAAMQLCLGQVSRVGPDELVSGFFFLACALLPRLGEADGRERRVRDGVLLGVVLGVGFLAKAVFLPLGCGMLLLLAVRMRGRRMGPVVVAGVVFAVMVAGYGVALSRAVGKPTLGEAGALNYAWHVNRLSKWVHWEGGVQTAEEAWPKPWVARFVGWDAAPPAVGTPVHPSRILQRAPLVYGFSAPVKATYVPYFDPPYWYAGYRSGFYWRYQVIALGKNAGDLMQVLVRQPMLWFVGFAVGWLGWKRRARVEAGRWVREHWLVAGCSLLGVLLYLPVHLEGRYLAGFFAVLAVCAVGAVAGGSSARQRRVAGGLVLVGLLAELVVWQRPVVRNLMARRVPERSVEWQEGMAVRATGLPAGSAVGVIGWTANLHCDWAYLAEVRITSETATGEDFRRFWGMDAAGQAGTLETFRRAGAVAVVSLTKPEDAGGAGWQQLGETPMWIYRFRTGA